jgi:hypothetical protein
LQVEKAQLQEQLDELGMVIEDLRKRETLAQQQL